MMYATYPSALDADAKKVTTKYYNVKVAQTPLQRLAISISLIIAMLAIQMPAPVNRHHQVVLVLSRLLAFGLVRLWTRSGD